MRSFIAVPDSLRPGPLRMISIRDTSSGRWAFNSLATGMEFKGREFSESMGDGAGTTGVSSRTGVTGDVLGKGMGVEYGFGRVKSFGIGCSDGIDDLHLGEVTLFNAAWMGVFTGEGEDGRSMSMVIGLMYIRGSSDGTGKGPGALHAITDIFGACGGHTILGAAKAPFGANKHLIRVPRPAFGGNWVYTRGEGSFSLSLPRLEVLKAFSESFWAGVSSRLTSSGPLPGRHFGASRGLTAVPGDTLPALTSDVWRFVRSMH